MKTVSICCFIVLIFINGCSDKNEELYKKTDAFVESLQSTYKSYGLTGGAEHATTTSDGLYKIMPVGRLINVRIEKVASDDEYETLKKDLADHYKNDARVNKVYISKGGTVMIDCRN